MINADEIYRRLRFYAATDKQGKTYAVIRDLTIDYATTVAAMLPESREKSQWLTVLEDSQMWANKSIAVNQAHTG